MKISRRDFLKYCLSSAAVIGLDNTVVQKLEKAFAAGGASLPTVVWLAGTSCTGCVISLANRISSTGPTDIADLLINYINVAYHPNLMAAAGDLAVQNLRSATTGSFILAVEGGIPSAFDGHSCKLWHEGGKDVTALEAVKDLSSRSIANLAIGTCASFGGVAAARPNPTQITSLKTATGKTTINIPGCPVHPDWVVWTIAQLLAGAVPALDSFGRPAQLFQGEARNVHENCPREDMDEVSTFGVVGCLKELGCKGPVTQGDCPTRKWNGGTNWCVNANGLCIACTEESFPDKFSPLYKVQTKTALAAIPLSVTQATWSSSTAQLLFSGTGKIGSQVVVKETSGKLIASRFIDRAGTWQITINNPAAVPASVIVLADGQSLTTNIKPATGSKTFAVTSAAWVASVSELRISGTGNAGSSVTIASSAGPILGKVTIDTQSNWSLTVKNLNPVPSAISAESNGQTVVANVLNAPVPPSGKTFKITLAQYSRYQRRLTVSGIGTPSKTVSIFNASSNALLGKTTVNANGQWTKSISIKEHVPTRVRAVSDNNTVEASVVRLS